MKKTLLFLILSCLLSGSSVWAEAVKLAIGDWEPYTSATNPKGKLLEKVVTEAFKLEGVEVKYEYFPWKRSIINAETGESDGTFPWNKTTEREGLFHIHKTSLLKDDSVYFHLKSTPFDWKSMNDIKKYKVGVTIGYKDEKIYKDKGINADPVPSEEMNFKKMLAGRIDVYMTSKVACLSGCRTFHLEMMDFVSDLLARRLIIDYMNEFSLFWTSLGDSEPLHEAKYRTSSRLQAHRTDVVQQPDRHAR